MSDKVSNSSNGNKNYKLSNNEDNNEPSPEFIAWKNDYYKRKEKERADFERRTRKGANILLIIGGVLLGAVGYYVSSFLFEDGKVNSFFWGLIIVGPILFIIGLFRIIFLK